MNLPDGHLLQSGKYRLTHVIGQGGFGITYKGVWFTEVKGPLGTIKTEVPVCVKEYFFKDYCYRDSETSEVKVHSDMGRMLFDKFKEKLIKEAKILSDVHHPHIVNVLEVFEENNTAYIVMEYISGSNLKSILEKDGILPEATVLRYIYQVGEALQFVHEKNILHLDIKPSNILIDQNGKARLIDFGVSKRYDIKQQETSTTMLTLSKGFASIEQYDSEGIQNFSPCPDIYSLGATMYNLLTGKIPTESILRATRPLPSPVTLNQAISSKTEAAIMKAMAVVPADRFQSVSEMLDALDCPKEEEGKVNRGGMSSPEYEGDDETTMLYSSQPQTKGDDETVLNADNAPITSKKKRRKTALVSLLIIIFASVGSAVVFMMQRSGPDLPVANVSDTTPEQSTKVVEDNSVSETTKEEPRREVENQGADTRQKVEEKPMAAPSSAKPEKPQKETTTKDVEKDVAMPSQSEEELNAEFKALIAAGKEKMAAAQASSEASDFKKATKDIVEAGNAFTKAGRIKTTDELFDLIGECRVKQNEILLAGRKEMYEEIKPFGELMIVQKKDNKKYGAIDAEAQERIKCKYLAAYRTQQGYSAFLREDEMYDIYDTNGVMISERLSDYY